MYTLVMHKTGRIQLAVQLLSLIHIFAADQWQHPELGILLIGNVFGSALLYGILSSFRFRSVRTDTLSRSGSVRATAIHESPQDCFALIDSCIEDAVSATVRIGVYLIVFSMLVDAAASVPLASKMCIRDSQ